MKKKKPSAAQHLVGFCIALCKGIEKRIGFIALILAFLGGLGIGVLYSTHFPIEVIGNVHCSFEAMPPFVEAS